MRKRWARLLAVAAVLTVAAILVATEMVNRAAAGRTYSDASRIPHRRAGLVLGCSKRLSDGRRNMFFDNRIAAASGLFRAGKVDYLIVSGDNHKHGYDEPTDMKNSLIAAGVPADRIYRDYAGFRTLDSVVRADAVFGQKEITIVSQEFHNRRAIFLAAHRGVDAIGFNAAEVDAYNSFRTRCREQASKVFAVLDIYVFRSQPRFLGTRIELGKASAA